MNSKHVHLWQRIVNSEYLVGSRVSLIKLRHVPSHSFRFWDQALISIKWHARHLIAAPLVVGDPQLASRRDMSEPLDRMPVVMGVGEMNGMA